MRIFQVANQNSHAGVDNHTAIKQLFLFCTTAKLGLGFPLFFGVALSFPLLSTFPSRVFYSWLCDPSPSSALLHT